MFVVSSIARNCGRSPTRIVTGRRRQPVVFAASHLWPFTTATVPDPFTTYTVFVFRSTAIPIGSTPAVTAVTLCRQPVATPALQVLPSISETVPVVPFPT